MIITLASGVEVCLREYAAREKRDPDLLANALLAVSLLGDEAARKEAFDQVLLAAGIITRISPLRDSSKAERPRFEVQGETLSKTIIRERR